MAHSLDAETLIRRLNQANARLDASYVVTGDEALLVIEAADAIRAAARNDGYHERISLTLDARSDWSSLISATQNVSLFGDRRLVDVAIPSGKPGKTGADTIARVSAMIKDGSVGDTLLMFTLPRLDRATQNAKWAQALLSVSTRVDVALVDRRALPDWIAGRLASQDQRLDRATLEWMADKVEGNLLAAHQEVQKLGLVYPPGELSAEDVRAAVLNVARYNVFGLRDAMLAGQADKALAMLEGLRAEGEALPLVLWAIGDEARVLARLAAAGSSLADEMRKLRVFGQHERLARLALSRVPASSWAAAVQHAQDIDCLIKGLKVPGRLDDPWEELGRLVLRIAVGRPTTRQRTS